MLDIFPASIDRRKDYSDHEAFRLYGGCCEDVGRISVSADDQQQHLQCFKYINMDRIVKKNM